MDNIFHDSRALARAQRSTMGKKIWFRNLVPRVLSVASKQPNFNRERARARDKKQRRPIFLEKKKHEKFIAGVKKWEKLAVTKVRMRGSEKKSEKEKTEHIRHFLHKTYN